MPIDIPEATAAPTTRRSFLVRAALGGAFLSAGTAMGPLSRLLPVAGAQEADPDAAPELSDAAFAAAAIPLELAAVQAYQAALTGGTLDGDWTDRARRFQEHHQTVADALTAMLDAEAPTPVPDPTIQSGTTAAITAAGDQNGALAPLAELETMLAATHLYAIGGLEDATTAKTVAQVLAVESQQAVLIGEAVGTDLASLTPPFVGTDEATKNLTVPAAGSTTSTTTAEDTGDTTTTSQPPSEGDGGATPADDSSGDAGTTETTEAGN